MGNRNKTSINVRLTPQQSKALELAISLNPNISGKGSYLEAAMKLTAETATDQTKQHSIVVGRDTALDLRARAMEAGLTVSDFILLTLFGADAVTNYKSPKLNPYIDFRLRDYENEAVKNTLDRYQTLGTFGGLISALRAGHNIKVFSPVPSSEWKDTNTRIYLPEDELNELRLDLDASTDTNTVYLLKLLFGSGYRRTPGKAGYRNSYPKRTKKTK